jgi:hypothetical protein
MQSQRRPRFDGCTDSADDSSTTMASGTTVDRRAAKRGDHGSHTKQRTRANGRRRPSKTDQALSVFYLCPAVVIGALVPGGAVSRPPFICSIRRPACPRQSVYLPPAPLPPSGRPIHLPPSGWWLTRTLSSATGRHRSSVVAVLHVVAPAIRQTGRATETHQPRKGVIKCPSSAACCSSKRAIVPCCADRFTLMVHLPGPHPPLERMGSS